MGQHHSTLPPPHPPKKKKKEKKKKEKKKKTEMNIKVVFVYTVFLFISNLSDGS
jgi:hypothetical protein